MSTGIQVTDLREVTAVLTGDDRVAGVKVAPRVILVVHRVTARFKLPGHTLLEVVIGGHSQAGLGPVRSVRCDPGMVPSELWGVLSRIRAAEAEIPS
jgi:hypothetical protein